MPDSKLERPAFSGSRHTEVAIIGAGFTGLNAALHLVEDGVEVVVLDAQFPGWGASGRNGGFCCVGGSKASDRALKRKFGEKECQAYREAEFSAVQFVADLLDAHEIHADCHSHGETQLAHRPKDLLSFKTQASSTLSDYGLECELLEERDLKQAGLAGDFHGALTLPVGFALNPRKYLLGLLRAAESRGATVFGKSPVSKIQPSGSGYSLSMPSGALTCDRLIIATNGYSSDDIPSWLAGRYIPTQSNVLVTRELTEKELSAQGWFSEQMAYDSRNLLHYFRLMPDRRFLFGMRGGLLSSPTSFARYQLNTRRDFEAAFPAWSRVETPWSWGGMVCISADLVPFCGPIPEMPGAYSAFGYHGNGVAMGSYCGAILADLVQEKNPRLPHPKILSFPRTKFPLGRLRRILLPPAYAYFALKDL